ncbi:SDR family NAD(P)-dependent oxidoreductase, partial [Micrococcus luteus]|uniref:SDR family NAD(P)-dependent oxidoreductase n=1 Tax=Micrococcus luteus TaxID=1270 RepID=UPI0011AB7D75
EITEAGGHAIAVQADITDAESRAGLFRAAVGQFGGVDVLILNASGGMETEMGEDYALRLNRDAQNDTLTEALRVLPEGGRVV